MSVAVLVPLVFFVLVTPSVCNQVATNEEAEEEEGGRDFIGETVVSISAVCRAVTEPLLHSDRCLDISCCTSSTGVIVTL